MKTLQFSNQLLGGMRAGLAFLGLFALAQHAVAQEEEVELTGSQEIEEVVVMGTATGTAIRGVAPVGAATLSVSQDDLLDSTSVDTTSFIRDLPQGSGLVAQEDMDTGGPIGNVGYAQGVNLRGLGSNATLILFDGHRLVGQGVTSQFADPNQLPISAIERVEVVMDAASAVYGSDAIAGVVNFVLRDDFDGVELNMRQTNALYDATAVDFLVGTSWNSGNVWFGAMYEDRGTFRNNERAYLMEDLRSFGGNDHRYDVPRPGAQPWIRVGRTIYGVPSTDGRVPTADEVRALDGQYPVSDRGDQTNYWPERERVAVSFRARQDLLDGRGTLTLTGVYSSRESWIEGQFIDYFTPTVNSRSPYWIPGLTSGTYTVGYSLFHNNQGAGATDVTNNPVEEALNTYLDFEYDINDNWRLSANLTYGDNVGCGRCGKREASSRTGIFRGATTTYADMFNPFLTGPQDYFDILYFQQDQRTWFTMNRGSLKAEGAIFDLDGGQARLAVGIDYEQTTQKLFLDALGRNAPGEYFVLRDAYEERDLGAAYVEAYLPFSDIVELNVAVRHDDYSDFGTTTNPRIGLNIQPSDEVTFRATAATAFRAPTLVETNPDVLEQLRGRAYSNDGSHDIPVTNANNGTTAVVDRIGNTPNLQPETADVWTAGVDYTPAAIENLRISATYYDVQYANRIENLSNLGQTAALASSANRELFDRYIIVAPQPDSCVVGDYSTYHPNYEPFTDSPNWGVGGFRVSECDLQAVVFGGTQNTGEVNQSGLDLQVSYDWQTAAGQFGVRFNGSKVLDLQRSPLPGDDPIDGLDRIGFQNSTRLVTRGIWRRDNWMVSLDATMVGSFLNDQPITVNGVRQPESTVPSWTTFGANVNYEVPLGEGSGLMDGVRIGLAVDNITDKAPPIVLSGTTAIDTTQHNVFGRIASLTLQKSF